MVIKVHFKIAITKIIFICASINFANGSDIDESSDYFLKDKIVF